MRDTVLASETIAQLEWVKPKLVERLMGHWAWILLLSRSAFCIPDQIYKWLHDAEDMTRPKKLWKAVRAEFLALAALSIYFSADLGAGWYPEAFMTDASLTGYAALHTKAKRK